MQVYIGATRQNDGKTTTALGLFNLLREERPDVGYMKPVGQQFRLIGEHRIDKDVTLMSEVFRIGASLPDMSPVTVPPGFTEDYIIGGDGEELRRSILSAYRRARGGRSFMVLEGTGHAGVGSVFGLSNAEVAALLKAPVIITTCAGIGRPIDEVALNKALFDSRGVPVIGVIVNKVLPEKMEKIDRLVRLGFRQQGIDVLGVLPYVPRLASPTIRQLLEDIKGELISGEDALDVTATKMIVGAMPPHTAIDYFRGDVLLITPGNREDLILAALSSNVLDLGEENNMRGIVLTGGLWPAKQILGLIKRSGIPVIVVQDDTFTAARRISELIVKIRPEDTEKVDAAKGLIREYVDMDMIMRKLNAAERSGIS